MRRPLPRFQLPLPRRAVELAARVRLESARRPWIRWSAVGSCALLVGLTVQHQAGALERARQRWGEQLTVLVADRPVVRGAPIGPGDVRRIRLPLAAVPSGALTDLPPAAIAVDALATGEVVSATHVRSRGAAGLPPGTSGVAVPVAEGGLRLATGQLVDVVDAGDPLLGGGPASPDDVAVKVLTRRAVVVAASTTSVVLAVTTAAAPSVAAAAARGAVVLILSEM